MHIRRRGGDRMNQWGSAIAANMRLHAEGPLVAFLALVHLGIPLLGAILRRTGTRIIVASTMVPRWAVNPCAAR